MRTLEKLPQENRSVTLVDERNLSIGSFVRKAPAQRWVLLNPTGAMLTTNPMNVAAFDGEGNLLWVLPVDFQRLTCGSTAGKDVELFRSTWRRVDDVMSNPDGGSIWYRDDLIVGEPPPGLNPPDWVEYQGPRPWLEVARLSETSSILVPLNVIDQPDKKPKRYQSEIRPSESYYFDKPDKNRKFVELSHFAVLDPTTEGLERTGSVNSEALGRAARRMQAWPQRGEKNQVLLEETGG